jgi:thioester reductase-like protein
MKVYEAYTSPEKMSHQHMPPPIGKPIAGLEMYVVDKYLEPVPIGCVGELLIGGEGLSVGYYQRKELTRDKFIRNIFSLHPSEKLYKTGDLVRWLDDGTLEFVGRIDHQIKIRGYRIELSEIETTLSQFPDVAEVIVIAKEIMNGQKSLIAYLAPNVDKIRIPYQERCLVSLDNISFHEVLTEDISKQGMAIFGLHTLYPVGNEVRINVRLPGKSEAEWLQGTIIWQINSRVGIKFSMVSPQKENIEKSIEYYLSTHNLMDTLLSAAVKRNVRNALKKKLPDYMIPTIFSILPHFPLTFNGKIDWKSLPPPKDFEKLLEHQFIEPRSETEKVITQIWEEVLNQQHISMTDNFFDLGGNSLLVSQLSIKILERFHISLPTKILFDLPFIPILAEYIDSNGEKYSYESTIQNDIQHDTILPDDILPTQNRGDIKSPGGILLTGAAGFLGIYLLRDILKKTSAKIYCFIRKGEFESAAKRLIANIEHYNLSTDIALSDRRITIIGADMGHDQFGLSREQYDYLAENVDVVYHCGAQVNTMASYTTVRQSNVFGTLEIIKFSTYKIDKAIHYISTLSAAVKKNEDNNFLEVFPDANMGSLIGGYALSKWVSERLLTQVKNRGLPVSIYRLGYILGDTLKGTMNLNDALLFLIKGCIELGLAPDWNEKIALIPVNFASHAVVNISLFHPEISHVYHLDHPKPILWNDLVAWLNDFGFNIKLCSYTEWRQHLFTLPKENVLYPFLSYYLAEETEPHSPGTAMEHTLAALNQLDISYPEINDDLLHLYMHYLCSSGFLPIPEKQKNKIFTSF